MLDIGKSANRQNRGLPEHVIKWPVSWNYGKVVGNIYNLIEARGGSFNCLLQGARVGGVSLEI